MEKHYKIKEFNGNKSVKPPDSYIKNYLSLQDGEKDSNIDKINNSIIGKLSLVSNMLNYVNKEQFSCTYKFYVEKNGQKKYYDTIPIDNETIKSHFASNKTKKQTIKSDYNDLDKIFLIINYLSFHYNNGEKDIICEAQKEAELFIKDFKNIYKDLSGQTFPFTVIEFKPSYSEEIMMNKFKCTTPIFLKFNGKNN